MAHEILEAMMDQGHIDRAQFHRITNSFTETIRASFAADGGRMTRDEVRRRFDIMARHFRMLRHEGWSVTRILDVLPTALRSKLDGGSWEPTTSRSIWVPPTASPISGK